MSAITADYGSELILPEDPVRQSYQFCGWYLDQEGTQQCTLATMPSLFTTVPKETGKPAAAPHKKIKLIKKIKKGRKKNTIFWKKVKGADGYCVYVAHGRKNSSKKYTSFRCIKTTRKTKAVHKGVKKDIWYRYRVDAYYIRRGKKIVVATSRYVCIRNKDFSCKNSA